MKLKKILDDLNSLEKNSFIKIIDSIITSSPENSKEIEELLSKTEQSELKNFDNIVISQIFGLIKNEFKSLIEKEFIKVSSQLDIISDVIIRDGNCMMSDTWFTNLYHKEIDHIKKKSKELSCNIEVSSKKKDVVGRLRDYSIYRSCLHVAYNNDLEHNRDARISPDELSILLTLSNELELSLEERKLINYSEFPLKKLEVDSIITCLKSIGILFYSKKRRKVYIADEIIYILREIRGKEIADKFFRRTLKTFKDSEINRICRKHNIAVSDQSKLDKIRSIISEGISFSGILKNDIHKEGVGLGDRKEFLNQLWKKGLKNDRALKGSTIEQKIENIIHSYKKTEKDDNIHISLNGYEKLLHDIADFLPSLKTEIKKEFELQEEDVLRSELLIDYNIKPRDILDLIPEAKLPEFCNAINVSNRGDKVASILSKYKDSENLYLENYVNISYRDLNALKENGVKVKEADIGNQFEVLTKKIFNGLGFNVDEELRKKMNTKKDKIDILINLGNNEIILIECKTSKESGYNKFSSVSRQMKSYMSLIDKKNFKIIKTLLIAPEFTDEFINDTELEYELNLSLIKAESLLNIYNGFNTSSKFKTFPYKLLMRDVVIQDNRILKAI